jgi:uncharacterized protein YwgA
MAGRASIKDNRTRKGANMKRLQRAAILVELTEQMASKGSWCGETHLQKATYFLQEVLSVPLKREFILYHYGPYSFELTEDLTSMRADELLEFEFRGGVGYGPSFVATKLSKKFRESYPVTLRKYADQISFIVEKLGDKNVKELERLATALFVSIGPKSKDYEVETRARKIHELKPHVSLDCAIEAVEEFDRLSEEAAELHAPAE